MFYICITTTKPLKNDIISTIGKLSMCKMQPIIFFQFCNVTTLATIHKKIQPHSANFLKKSCYFLTTSRDTHSKCGEQHLIPYFLVNVLEKKKNSLNTSQVIFRFRTNVKFCTKKKVGCNLLVLECWNQGPKVIAYGILFQHIQLNPLVDYSNFGGNMKLYFQENIEMKQCFI